MKLYSGPLSLFTGKVRIALDEKQLPYELISVPFSRASAYSPKLPEMLALNPKGQVPVLVDDEVAVYDSTLILEYLEDRYPEHPLYPRDAVGRAHCRQLEAAADEILFPQVWELIAEVFYKPDPATRDAARVGRAQAAIAEHYDGLERRLAERQFLCGEFSVADIGYFLTLTFAGSLGATPAPSQTALNAWAARVMERPSVTREVVGLQSAAQRL
jgi:glutathione S-transferase